MEGEEVDQRILNPWSRFIWYESYQTVGLYIIQLLNLPVPELFAFHTSFILCSKSYEKYQKINKKNKLKLKVPSNLQVATKFFM